MELYISLIVLVFLYCLHWLGNRIDYYFSCQAEIKVQKILAKESRRGEV